VRISAHAGPGGAGLARQSAIGGALHRMSQTVGMYHVDTGAANGGWWFFFWEGGRRGGGARGEPRFNRVRVCLVGGGGGGGPAHMPRWVSDAAALCQAAPNVPGKHCDALVDALAEPCCMSDWAPSSPLTQVAPHLPPPQRRCP
jgi:hypothetical protein